MTLGSILLATALLLLVGVMVARPLLVNRQSAPLPITPRDRLLAEKEALLTQIRALDFDFETGKTPEAAYQQDRLRLMQQAAEKLRELDKLPQEESVEARIEAAVTALRGGQPEAADAPVCPSCGEGVAADDKFCRVCGERLYVEA